MNNTTALIAASAIIASTAILTPTLATATEETGPSISAAIRCTNGQWAPINDAGHASKGITKVVAGTKYITIYHTDLGHVGSMQVTADYDYNNLGITAGASVGTTYSRVNFSRAGKPISPASACQDWTNIWITGWGN